MSDFIEEAKRRIHNARQKKWRILIWGPGKPGVSSSPADEENYQKRCQIRSVLTENFPRSDIKFSEDIEIKEVIGILPKQALQASTADLIIILLTSQGAYFELNYFVSRFSWVRDRLYLLVPEQHLRSEGIQAEFFKRIPEEQRLGFTAEQFHRCDVAKEMSLNIATTAAISNLLLRKK